jgi:tRNA(Ile)-lysidine synthase
MTEDLLPEFLDALAGTTAPTPWIAALSGGPDSVALCHLLSRTSIRVIAVHVNHKLRGEAGDRDQAFSAETAERLGLAFRARTLAPEGRGSMESWARQARYRALRQAAEEEGAGAVLTGHHRDDQAETVLQRLMRGAGYRGLSGIRPQRPIDFGSPIRLVRPLLSFSRARIETYLEANGCPHVTDETNHDDAIQRNRLRRKTIPALERALPGIREELDRIADAARGIDERLTEAARVAVKRYASPLPWPLLFGASRDVLILKREAVNALPQLFLHPLYREVLAGFQEQELSRSLSLQAMELPAGGRLQMGRDIFMQVRESSILFERTPGRHRAVPLSVPGFANLPGEGRIEARISNDRESSNPSREVLDADRTGDALVVRQREPGDRFHPLGAPGARKLKDFLINEKVPQGVKDRLALVCNDRDILWVPGLRIHHGYRVTEATRRFLVLEAT